MIIIKLEAQNIDVLDVFTASNINMATVRTYEMGATDLENSVW